MSTPIPKAAPGSLFSLLLGRKATDTPAYVNTKPKKSTVNFFHESLPPFIPSRNTESGINPCALRPSGSCDTEAAIYEEKSKRRTETQERNVAYGEHYAITSELIPSIVEKLRSCPIDALSLRVFRQHTDMGLCWHDSFFMMFFENQATKPFALQLLTDFLTILLEKNYPGLKYNSTKTTLIARTLKDKYKSTLKLSIWEHITLALQRYALLGFLFVTESPTVAPSVIKSPLGNRRPSLGEANFDQIHEYLKLGTMSCWEGGASMGGILKFMYDVSEFVKEQTKDSLILENVKTSEIKPTKTVGYYFTIQAEASATREWDIIGSAHIMSLFLCDSTWFLYDNETGVLPLSSDFSQQITETGIVSMQIYRSATEFIYKLTLGDTSVLTAKMPHTSAFGNESESEYFALTLPQASYRLVINPTNSTNLKSVGGRRRIKSKNKTRKAH